MTVASYVLEVDWVNSGELFANPHIESAVSGTATALTDPFANLLAWTPTTLNVASGGSFSVASNVVSGTASGNRAMYVGHQDWWDTGTSPAVMRFLWRTGGVIDWWFHWDGNTGALANGLIVEVTGVAAGIYKVVNGTITSLTSQTVTLSDNTQYWFDVVIQGTTVTLKIFTDSPAGTKSVTQVGTTATATDAALAGTGRTVVWLGSSTNALQIGGAFSNVYQITMPAVPNWTPTPNGGVSAFAVSKANKYGGLYSLSIFNKDSGADGYWNNSYSRSMTNGDRLTVLGRIKTSGVASSAFITPGGGALIAQATGTVDWTEYTNDASNIWNFGGGAYSPYVRLSGAGTAWFDDLSYGLWTDESANLISASWRRGRDYASQLTGRASAGTLDANLNNVAGRYAPLNTAGALYGSLLPGRRVRLRTTAPIVEILWQGFLDEIRPSPGSRNTAPTATLRASGPLRWIADKKASTAIYTTVLTGAAVGYILDDAGWPTADRTLDVGQITMNRWKADGDSALSHLQELEEMEFGYIGESKDGKIVWEDAQHRVTLTTSQATFSDANAAALSYDDIEELDPWRDVYNIFTADVTLFTVQGLAVLWSMTGETPSINAGVTKDFWALYPTSSSATQADHVDAWTTPVVTTDFLANTLANGTGTNKSAAIVVSVSKFANSMKISLQNTDAGAVFITFLQARGTAAYENNPIRIVSEDAASQTKFGKRTFPLPGKFYPSTAVAKSYVDAGLARFKDQMAILQIRFQANQDSAHMTQALTRTVGERISVVANGTTASGAQLGIVADFFIEAEQHTYDLSAHWVTYSLSDARTVSGYWLLGVSQLGLDTKLGI